MLFSICLPVCMTVSKHDHWLFMQAEALGDQLYKRNNLALTCRSPRRPDLTPCNFFLVEIYQKQCLAHPLPASVIDPKQRITTAAESVDGDMLQCGLNELDYRIDICSVRKGLCIEHL
jgi:hypothetical protein